MMLSLYLGRVLSFECLSIESISNEIKISLVMYWLQIIDTRIFSHISSYE